jgi:hypothetical protein
MKGKKNQPFSYVVEDTPAKSPIFFKNICFRFEHSLTSLTPLSHAPRGRGGATNGCSEWTPLPPGEGIKG